jgi:general secretion pathway protein C
MNLFLRRALPCLTLLCVACACGALAFALNSVADAWLQPPPPSPDRLVQKAPPRREELPTPLALVPLRRYLGLPEKVRQEVLPAPEEAHRVAPRADLRLLGTMLGTYSLASVFDSPSQRTRSLWMGQDFDGARVVAIERTRVLLSRGDQLEVITDQAVRQRAEPRLRTADTTLEQLGPETYELSRQEVNHALANINEIALQARIVPAFQDGVAKGFKVFSIRPDSLFTRLGLRNGDILRRINGLSLGGVEQALEAYTRLRDASRIELEVERDGQVLHPTYTVRG